ncbi:MAG TPA: cyclic 2,3-diphosphoglycerate synthase [Actinomycetota bacterium]
MGAAGRDFHNFNVAFRDDPDVEVVAFTATQIPFITDRTYPVSLAGAAYPKGIPIVDERELAYLIGEERVSEVVFAYSDVTHEHVMHCASTVLAAGADFRLMGPKSTALTSDKTVVTVCAARTGAGKSQTTRRVVKALRDSGRTVVVVRHPMPYGDLEAQRVQRFATAEDLDREKVTIEEREEFEPHLANGTVVYCGVDYAEILHRAEGEAEVIVWDGGNNDLPFFQSDLHIVVVDPLRAGHEKRYHPGEANVRMADVVVINKMDSASTEQVKSVEASVHELNPTATIVRARSPITVTDEAPLAGKRVLVVEDGPTLTHGEMAYGAGVVAAKEAGAAEIVDPRPYAVGTIRDVYASYPDVGALLPAMGYSDQQVADLAATINATPADVVVIATPVDLRRLARFDKPAVRVSYELAEEGSPTIAAAIAAVLE